jgi:hypothetical protein
LQVLYQMLAVQCTQSNVIPLEMQAVAYLERTLNMPELVRHSRKRVIKSARCKSGQRLWGILVKAR